MLIVFVCMALAWALIAFAPDSPLGRVLSRMLVEAPARWLSKLTFGRLIWTGLALFVIWRLIAIARTEASFIIAQGLPEVVGWAVTLDGASAFDTLALAFVLAAGVGLKAARAAASTIARRLGARTGRARRRPRRPRKLQAPTNEDEPAVFALAA